MSARPSPRLPQGPARPDQQRLLPAHRKRAHRGPGKAIDISTIFAPLFGSAVSLGLGALQINSGLTNFWDVPKSTPLAIGIIAVVTVAFVVSAVTGVKRGIQFVGHQHARRGRALRSILKGARRFLAPVVRKQ